MASKQSSKAAPALPRKRAGPTQTDDSHAAPPPVTSPAKETQIDGLTQGELPAFHKTQHLRRLTSKGALILTDISAMIDKGFFKAENNWTCYRRNYFQVRCGIILKSDDPSHISLIGNDGTRDQKIVDFAVSISAVIDGTDGRSIELVQHGPKRDKGPHEQPPRVIVKPIIGFSEEQSQRVAIFERIQFKSATANNGKRRAFQQFFCIVIEAWANIDDDLEPWVRIAKRTSAPLVVRGRSPGHYHFKDEGTSIGDLYSPSWTIHNSQENKSSHERHEMTFPGPFKRAYFPLSPVDPTLREQAAKQHSGDSLQQISSSKSKRKDDLAAKPGNVDFSQRLWSSSNEVVPFTERSSIDVNSTGDNSSVSSVSDSFSGSAPSSVSSLAADPIDAPNQFVSLLLNDRGFKALCVDGFRNLDANRFERNLRRLLKHYSTALCQEATREVEVLASKFIRRRSRYAASAIRRTVGSDSIYKAQVMRVFFSSQSKDTQAVERYLHQRHTLETQEELDFAQVHEVNDGGTNSDTSGSDDPNYRDQLALPNLQVELVKDFLIDSNAFEDLREGLMGFVIPIQIAAQKCDPSEQLISEKVYESLRFAKQGVAESSVLSGLGFSNLIIDFCGILISQCTKSSPNEYSNLVEKLHEFLELYTEVSQRHSYITNLTPDQKKGLQHLLQSILGELETLQIDIEMESTKRLQERYQWKEERQTGTLEVKDAQLHANDEVTSSPTGQSSFPRRLDDLLLDDKEIYPLVLRTRLDRLLSLTIKLKDFLQLSNTAVNESIVTTLILEDAIRTVENISYYEPKPAKRSIMFDCGIEIYGDFENTNPQAVDELAKELHYPDTRTTTSSPSNGGTNNSSRNQFVNTPGVSILSQPTTVGIESISNSDNSLEPPPSIATLPTSNAPPTCPKYIALCVNTGGIYKTLAEVEISSVTSDIQLFRLMKQAYLNARGFRTKFTLLIKPVEIHFVHFNLWNLQEGYISICDKPKSIPPKDTAEYEYMPRPLVPMPPMPSEVFIHYLEHNDRDCSLTKNVWVPRLPKKLNKRMIECDIPAYGWGIHIIEGPNRHVVFWMVMATVLGSILATILWSSLHKDMQVSDMKRQPAIFTLRLRPNRLVRDTQRLWTLKTIHWQAKRQQPKTELSGSWNYERISKKPRGKPRKHKPDDTINAIYLNNTLRQEHRHNPTKSETGTLMVGTLRSKTTYRAPGVPSVNLQNPRELHNVVTAVGITEVIPAGRNTAYIRNHPKLNTLVLKLIFVDLDSTSSANVITFTYDLVH
ncbi:hypothetical protein V500_01441 [Pseudogymnoascus sp. VKM F-4518 (FW-2643)]|nr:hypothetical protein V500_01441 [Pseudogymnoascus sp. VKM F-4518 (FW-2643)]